MTTEVTNIFAKWNKPHFVKKFYGVTLGYFEHKNINTGEMLIIEAIIDATHKRFAFMPHLGIEAQSVKDMFDQAQTTSNSAAIAWIWRDGQQFHRKILLYNVTNDFNHLSNITLVGIVCNLWQLCQQYKETYKDNLFPKLPRQLRLNILEEACKSAIDWRQ